MNILDIPAGTGFDAGSKLRTALANIKANFATIKAAFVGITTSGAADYIPVLTDATILRSRATAQTVTIPANATTAFDIGSEIKVIQTGAGALTIVAAGGVTTNVLATKTLVAAGQHGVVRLKKIAINTWNVSGDLTAAA